MTRYSPADLFTLLFPKGRWFIKKINQQPTLYTTNLGSRIRILSTAATKITINVLDNGNAISPSQIYAWRIDNQEWHRVAAAHLSWTINCTPTPHVIEIITAGNTDLDQIWTGNEGFAISSIEIDAGELTTAPQLPVINFIGDSITAGCWVTGRHASYDYRPESNYVGTAVDLLHATDVRIAYSAAGVLRQATGGVPTANRFLTRLDAHTSWQPSPAELTVVNLGVNDRRFPIQQFNESYDHFLQLLSRFISTPVLIMVPFSQSFAEPIRLLAKKYQLPLIETAGWCSSYTDGLHPDQAGATESGQLLAQKLSNWLK